MRPRQYQIEGAKFLAGRKRAYLADVMRLGKTPQALWAAKALGLQRILCISPAVGVPNWPRIWDRIGGKANTFASISYNRAVSDVDINGADWDLVILDEAHYVKTPTSKRTKAALRIAKQAPRAWLLSGSPMPNHPGELYAPIAALWPEIFGQVGLPPDCNNWGWFERFCNFVPTVNGPRVTGAKDGATLRKALSGIMLRRHIKDVFPQLPPVEVDVQLLPHDVKFENELGEFASATELEGLLDAESRGTVSTLRRFLGQYKAPLIADVIVDELKNDLYRKVVVMAHHHATLDALQAKFEKAGLEVVGFRGGASEKERVAAEDEFREGTPRVFLSQQQASGVAIDLSAATEIVLAEPEWSPEENAQAIMRIQNVGQPAKRRARYFAVADTLDDSIMTVNARKTQMIAEGLPSR